MQGLHVLGTALRALGAINTQMSKTYSLLVFIAWFNCQPFHKASPDSEHCYIIFHTALWWSSMHLSLDSHEVVSSTICVGNRHCVLAPSPPSPGPRSPKQCAWTHHFITTDVWSMHEQMKHRKDTEVKPFVQIHNGLVVKRKTELEHPSPPNPFLFNVQHGLYYSSFF